MSLWRNQQHKMTKAPPLIEDMALVGADREVGASVKVSECRVPQEREAVSCAPPC